jgi:CheY-like chemotaxis protein
MSRILVADDSVSLRMLVRRVLTMHGHEVVEADDGLRAREKLTDERPDLAIFDIVMPGLSGLDLCRLVRADPELRETGLIVISANLSEDDALAAGADAFLGKPFRPPELLATLAAVSAARATTAVPAE